MMNVEILYLPGYIRNIDPVSVEPVTVMSRWKLVEVRNTDGRRSCHLVGRADYEGRVCSAIVSVDLEALRMITQSGRFYVLEGPPGRDSDADWVFGRWLKIMGNPKHRAITRALMRLRRRQAGAWQ